ncbi:MAG: hypothetical protein MZV64_30155 [Ignavibacteriales bacterium]|nr:hypothetical protein [Ignavibacteriales bacterium]
MKSNIETSLNAFEDDDRRRRRRAELDADATRAGWPRAIRRVSCAPSIELAVAGDWNDTLQLRRIVAVWTDGSHGSTHCTATLWQFWPHGTSPALEQAESKQRPFAIGHDSPRSTPMTLFTRFALAVAAVGAARRLQRAPHQRRQRRPGTTPVVSFNLAARPATTGAARVGLAGASPTPSPTRAATRSPSRRSRWCSARSS